MLHKEIPFLRIMVPLCSGIVAGLWYNPGNAILVISAIIIIIGFLAGTRFNRQLSNRVYGVSLTCALFISGLALYNAEKDNISSLPPKEACFSGYLEDYPEEKENTFKLLLRLENRTSAKIKEEIKGTLLLYVRKSSRIDCMLPGDRIVVRCSPQPITSRGNPEEFDYSFYMETRGVKYFAFADTSDIADHSLPERRKLIHKALIVREEIIAMFRNRGITGKRLALVSAITLGQKNMLDPEQKQWFIKAGIMHIMAVSGLHAVILSLFVFKLLFFLSGRLKPLRVIITIILLWAFAFVTGLTPSVMRATLMFSFLQAGTLLKRPANGINSVLASAFVLILIRPSVIFDAGFLLSYAAVIYIICFYRDLYSKLRFRYKIADWFWQSAAVTIIAQAGTLPLTIMLFNRFPTWFILSNVIIVPISSLVIIAGAMIPLTYPVVFLSRIIAQILGFLTGLTETLTQKAAEMPLATIENIGMTTIECFFLTIGIFLITRSLLIKRSVPPGITLSVILLFITSGTIRVIATKTTAKMEVYNTQGYYAIGIREGRNLNIFSDSAFIGPEIKRECAVYNLKPELNLVRENPSFIQFRGNKILLSDRIDDNVINKTGAEIVILTGKHPSVGTPGRNKQGVKAVIISPEAAAGFKFISSPGWNADTITSIRRDGAFSLRL